jgi:hypothetical protein
MQIGNLMLASCIFSWWLLKVAALVLSIVYFQWWGFLGFVVFWQVYWLFMHLIGF